MRPVLRNGHNSEREMFVAPTRIYLKDALQTKDVKVENVKSLGQHTVRVILGDNYVPVAYKIQLENNEKINIPEGNLGNNFLRRKFKKQTDKLQYEMDEYSQPIE